MPLLWLCLPPLKATEFDNKESFWDRVLKDPISTLEGDEVFEDEVSWLKTGNTGSECWGRVAWGPAGHVS